MARAKTGVKALNTAFNAAASKKAKTAAYTASSMMGGGLRGAAKTASFGVTGGSGIAHIAGQKGSLASSIFKSSGLGSSTKSAMKQAGKNLSVVGWDQAKSTLARSGVRYAAGGAVAGAAISGIQGENMLEGAGTGAMRGGMLGLGMSGARMGMGATSTQSSLAAAKDFGQKTGVSKSVTALSQMAKSARNSPTNMRRR